MGDGVNDRSTPLSLFAPLHEEFKFTLDGAASHERYLLPSYSTLDGTFVLGTQIDVRDGLQFPWRHEVVFVNPPYGRGLLQPFVERAAYESANNHAVVVELLPVRTEQPWFHDYVWCEDLHRPYDGVEVRFTKGRVKYDGLAAAPFPSMLVIWR